jgi:hypothetical protein
MLRWCCGHIRRDRVRNDDIRDRVGVTPIEEKLIQHRLRWFGHVQRRSPEASVRSGPSHAASCAATARPRNLDFLTGDSVCEPSTRHRGSLGRSTNDRNRSVENHSIRRLHLYAGIHGRGVTSSRPDEEEWLVAAMT